MRRIQEVLEYLAAKPDMIRDSALGPLTYRVQLAPPIGGEPPEEIAGVTVSEELRELWRHTSELRVAEESRYGQWGLVVVCPDECASLTHEFRADYGAYAEPDDLIIGYFRGDSELVLLPRGSSSQAGNVLIVLPLDRRADWPTAASSLGAFLLQFATAEDKWWPG